MDVMMIGFVHLFENTDKNTKGIPEFWLTIFKNVDLLSAMIQVS